MGRRLIFWIVLLLGLGGCTLHPPASTPPSASPQRLEPFLTQLPPPPDAAERARLYRDLLARRYAPWRLERPSMSRQAAAWGIRYLQKGRWYGLNRRPLSPSVLARWIENANFSAYGTLNRHAITTHPSNLRLLPTARPIFRDPRKPGEGYPFDYNQNSAINPWTPLLVSHLSRDRGWAFVQSPFAAGWLPLRDIAYVDAKTLTWLMGARLGVFLRDHCPVYDHRGDFLFYVKSATLAPTLPTSSKTPRLLVPERCGPRVRFVAAPLPCREDFAPMPLPMTRANVRRVASGLLAEPYGWGGIAGARDCSAMTRDFFLPFGVWLPRNSKAQAAVGEVIDLRGLSPRQKEQKIIRRGLPFRTLIYLPGHIMLYVGHRHGRVYVMHNTWGIHTKEGGRLLIGRGVITDLYLGEGREEVSPKALLIHRIRSFNIVVPRTVTPLPTE